MGDPRGNPDKWRIELSRELSGQRLPEADLEFLGLTLPLKLSYPDGKDIDKEIDFGFRYADVWAELYINYVNEVQMTVSGSNQVFYPLPDEEILILQEECIRIDEALLHESSPTSKPLLHRKLTNGVRLWTPQCTHTI